MLKSMTLLALALGYKYILHHFANCKYTARYHISFCTDIDECLMGNQCGEYEVCVNTFGGYMCACPDGYTRNTTTGVCEGEENLMEIIQENA